MKHAQSGITVIEACAALAIAAILAGTALPSFRDLADARRLEGLSAELSADLQHARTLSVSRREPIRLAVPEGVEGGSCYVMHTGPLGACSCDASGASACSEGAEAIKSVGLPAAGGVGVLSNVESVLFDPVRGTVSPTATVRLSAADGREIRHVVNLMGRLRTCDSQRPAPGRPAC